MDSAVEQVKARLNIAEVVGQYVKLERAGHNMRARCPFHRERTPSFMISPERGTYICFGCGEKGDIFSFVQKIEGIEFRQALVQLAERAGVALPKYAPAQESENKEHAEVLREVCEAATKFYESIIAQREDIQTYIVGRGVHPETLHAWRLGYAPADWRQLSEHLLGKGFSHTDIVEAGLAVRSERKPEEIYDRFRGRIMFPLCDVSGKVIAFSGRFFEKVPGSKEEGEPAKYVNSPETALFKKSRVLFGLDKAKHAIRKADCILLVEGQFDVVLSHQSGLPFAVAISGTALTDEHLSLLSRLSKRLVLALDGDAAGLRSGLRSAAMALAAGFDVKVPRFEDGKDPADLAKENPELLRSAVRASKTAIEFFLDALRQGARDERVFKQHVEAQILPLVAVLPSKIEQAHFVHIVAERLCVPEEAVRAEVAKRPKLPEAGVVESVVVAPEALSLIPLERTAALLVFGAGAEVEAAVAELFGAERLQALVARLHEEAERYRFEFDTLGDAAVARESLLRALERGTLSEKIEHIKEVMRLSSGEAQATLAQELSVLKRREQSLRA